MRVFEERQKFTQWWIYAIFIAMLSLGFFKIENFSSFGAVASIIIPVLLIMLFLSFTLETKIDQIGIHAYFKPFPFFKRSFLWGEINNCYVRKYSPLTEFGGWGIRGIGTADAYNVKGNMGIQIYTQSKTAFLIGTQKPEKAQKTIDIYFKKN